MDIFWNYTLCQNSDIFVTDHSLNYFLATFLEILITGSLEIGKFPPRNQPDGVHVEIASHMTN